MVTRKTRSVVPSGQLIAQRHGAVCVGAVDGAVWLTHLKGRGGEHRAAGIDAASERRTYRDICYWERRDVGYLRFEFSNGAMSTTQCRRLPRPGNFFGADPSFHQARARFVRSERS